LDEMSNIALKFYSATELTTSEVANSEPSELTLEEIKRLILLTSVTHAFYNFPSDTCTVAIDLDSFHCDIIAGLRISNARDVCKIKIIIGTCSAEKEYKGEPLILFSELSCCNEICLHLSNYNYIINALPLCTLVGSGLRIMCVIDGVADISVESILLCPAIKAHLLSAVCGKFVIWGRQFDAN
jgi:hypothetical protein